MNSIRNELEWWRGELQKQGKMIDVRSPEEYDGTRLHMEAYPNEGALRGGHIPPVLLQLADRVVLAGRAAFASLIEEDATKARAVLRGDSAIDRLDRLVRDEVHDLLAQASEVESALDSYRMSRELERVGDHLANVGEDVIYLITGEIVRHHASA